MKKVILLLLGFLFGFNAVSLATHYLGSEISYHQTSVNTYQVTLKLYRDCAGVGVTNPVAVNIASPGCNAGRTLPLALASVKLNKPFGPAISLNCSANSRLNYEIVTYKGTLTFSAAEAACSDWVLSWSECCRPNIANLVGQADLYTETKLKLTAGVINSSPAFDTLQAPAPYAGINLMHNLSFAAVDPDGDSLVYSWASPLSAANTPITYKPAPSYNNLPGLPPNIIINPNPRPPFSTPFNPQLALVTFPPPLNYSALYPMPTLYVNWNGPATIPYPGAQNGLVWEAKHKFELNPVQGEFSFVPGRFIPGATSASGENMYAVSIMVEEYRKINGVMTNLGSIRRETMILVADYGANGNPEVVSKTANNQAISSGYEIQLRPGTPLTLQFTGKDDSTQAVAVSSNVTYILPGATFSAASVSALGGTINWTPTAAHVRWQPYYFQVMLRDNSDPVRGVWVETFAVRVSNTGSVTSTPEALRNVSFNAFPNPFTEELTFNFNLTSQAESLVIYNLLGQQIETIPLKTVGLGAQKVQWQNAGKHAAGTYVARLISVDKTIQTLKFTKLQ